MAAPRPPPGRFIAERRGRRRLPFVARAGRVRAPGPRRPSPVVGRRGLRLLDRGVELRRIASALRRFRPMCDLGAGGDVSGARHHLRRADGPPQRSGGGSHHRRAERIGPHRAGRRRVARSRHRAGIAPVVRGDGRPRTGCGPPPALPGRARVCPPRGHRVGATRTRQRRRRRADRRGRIARLGLHPARRRHGTGRRRSLRGAAAGHPPRGGGGDRRPPVGRRVGGIVRSGRPPRRCRRPGRRGGRGRGGDACHTARGGVDGGRGEARQSRRPRTGAVPRPQGRDPAT